MSSKNEPSMMSERAAEMMRYDATFPFQQQRPSKLFSQQSRGPSFTALTLADELENEKRGIPPDRIDPVLEKRITEGQQQQQIQMPLHPSRQQQRLEDPSPISPGNCKFQF
uniref:Uncharacterized protein n=2 Tax=Panagrolaimus sp. PS1159 TaxID=55785 RepID=A0AC35FW92_9BILA